jgi:WhiB family redox-sensing transcriptional regulator
MTAPALARVMAAAPGGAVDWRDEALCAQTDPEAFFPESGHVEQAKRVCGRCPVQAACLEFALSTDQRFGVWGGRSARERRALKPTTATPGTEV